MSSLYLLTALSRSLAHQLRTPLSVVVNELSYLKTLVPEGECERALGKCREIAALLSNANCLRSSESRPQAVPLSKVFELVSTVLPVGSQTLPAGSARVMVDESMLQEALVLLESALAARDRCEAFSTGASELEIQSPSTLCLTLSRTNARSEVIAESTSLTKLLAQLYDQDSYEAPLFDALLEQLGVQLRGAGYRDGGLRLELDFQEAAS